MQFLLGLVAGLIIGWVIEWFIDWQFWRADTEGHPFSGLLSDADTQRLRDQLEQAQSEIDTLRAQLDSSAQAGLEAGATRRTTVPLTGQPVVITADRLETIKGIGPVFAKRLNEAGIFTFADLANADPDALRGMVEAQDWQATDTAAWIIEASLLASAADKGE